MGNGPFKGDPAFIFSFSMFFHVFHFFVFSLKQKFLLFLLSCVSFKYVSMLAIACFERFSMLFGLPSFSDGVVWYKLCSCVWSVVVCACQFSN